MNIFSSIKNAIFGRRDEANAQAANPATTTTTTTAAAPVQEEEVDVEAILEAKAQANGGNLNWQNSIVDLMKTLDMDSSLDNRKALAQELGYQGPLDGSADMNTRLHRAVMKALSVNGGEVPPQMMD